LYILLVRKDLGYSVGKAIIIGRAKTRKELLVLIAITTGR